MASEKKARLRNLASGAVLWIGLALIGAVAIPAGLLFSVIILIWDVLNFILKKIEKA